MLKPTHTEATVKTIFHLIVKPKDCFNGRHVNNEDNVVLN